MTGNIAFIERTGRAFQSALRETDGRFVSAFSRIKVNTVAGA